MGLNGIGLSIILVIIFCIMKNKIVVLMALVLTLFHGLKAEDVDRGITLNATMDQNFTAVVGQQDEKTLLLSYDPNAVVRMSMGITDSLVQGTDFIDTKGHSVSVEGADKQMFSASILSVTTSMTTYIVTVKVKVTYSPTEAGMHHAVLKVFNIFSGEAKSSINLVGEAVTPLKGDVDGDGQVSINDLTEAINALLNGKDVMAADIDCDGMLTITDITYIIDIILGESSQRLCTYLLVSQTDGITREYLIDEKTRVKISKPNLVIQTDGQVLTYPLEDLKQLRYEEREINLNSKLATEHQHETASQTLNTLLP